METKMILEKYLSEAGDFVRDEFYAWARANNGKKVRCEIVDGGMLLAIVSGKLKVKGGSILEFSVDSSSGGEIKMPYAAIKIEKSKMALHVGDTWIIHPMSSKISYVIGISK